MSNTQLDISRVCDDIKKLLLEKNRKYGDSALEPVRVMSQSSAVEQILVRLDDKLSRISRGAGLLANDEDVINDIIGYFVLLKIAIERDCQDAFKTTRVKRPSWDSDENWMVSSDGVEHTDEYYDRYRNRPASECGWDPNAGPSC